MMCLALVAVAMKGMETKEGQMMTKCCSMN